MLISFLLAIKQTRFSESGIKKKLDLRA